MNQHSKYYLKLHKPFLGAIGLRCTLSFLLGPCPTWSQGGVYTAAHHQEAIEMLWLLFWGALVVHVVHLYMYVVNGTAQQAATVDVSLSLPVPWLEYWLQTHFLRLDQALPESQKLIFKNSDTNTPNFYYSSVISIVWPSSHHIWTFQKSDGQITGQLYLCQPGAHCHALIYLPAADI